MLMDHADSQLLGIHGGIDHHFPAIYMDAALIGVVNA